MCHCKKLLWLSPQKAALWPIYRIKKPMNLQELPPDTRPREKILTRGPSALSDTELLALLLRTGIAGRNVLQLAQDMLMASGGLANLLLTLPQHTPAIKGLGPAKQAELLAVMELAKRAMAQQLSTREVMQSAASVQLYLQLHLAHTSHEVFAMLFLDAQHKLICMETLFRGTLSQTSVYPREVVLRALHHQSAAVVLAHNHPSGSVHPSPADLHLTQSLKSALAMVDVRVLDHVIVGPGQAFSMAEQGVL
jgi:DNA repair protein RadC